MIINAELHDKIAMLYPQDLEQKLGFDRIREHLRELCLSPLGQAFVQKIRFSDNFAVIDKLTRQTAEMKAIMEETSASFLPKIT